jgi:hypothetical protein
MKCFLNALAVLIAASLLQPTEAWAWGIGVHLQVGSWVLDNLSQLPAHIQLLLSTHSNDYLYGCISADITLGKKYTHYLKHCHSWRMGKQVLDVARSDSQKACALGYLSHLAADSIAHSYFVPYKLIRTYNTVMLKHAYWEMRFEAHVESQIWPLARSIARKDFSGNDEMLRSVLADTIFSFTTNKRIFNSLLLLNRLQQWQKMLRSLASTSKWPITEEDQAEYLGLAQEATMSLLCDLEASPYLEADPTGERALTAAHMIRKNLNLLWRDGRIDTAMAEEMILGFKTRLRQGIRQPDSLLDLLSAA